MKFLKLVMIVGALALFVSPSLKAGTTTFTFSDCTQITPPLVTCPNADAGTNHLTYTSGGLVVNAFGFVPPSTPEDLYVKNLGAGETGLGTMIDAADHEITEQDFVNLDLSNLVSKGIFSGTIELTSLQAGEGYLLCQGSSDTTFGSNCLTTHAFGSGTVDVAISWTGSTDVIGIMGYRSILGHRWCGRPDYQLDGTHAGAGNPHFAGHGPVRIGRHPPQGDQELTASQTTSHRARFGGPFFSLRLVWDVVPHLYNPVPSSSATRWT